MSKLRFVGLRKRLAPIASLSRRCRCRAPNCQFRQLCDGRRTLYLAFDADANGSGQKATQSLAGRLAEQGVDVCTVVLPNGQDPNSFFVQGGDARQFQSLLEAAR
jgi:DNA primase